jgi:hypothetical protein
MMKKNYEEMAEIRCCRTAAQAAASASKPWPTLHLTVAKPAAFFSAACEKRHSFLNFSYVCPEPVLVKCSCLHINGAESGVFRTCVKRHQPSVERFPYACPEPVLANHLILHRKIQKRGWFVSHHGRHLLGRAPGDRVAQRDGVAHAAAEQVVHRRLEHNTAQPLRCKEVSKVPGIKRG